MLTPVDIQNKIFKGGIGFDKKDVEAFMNEISSDYSMLYRSNVELKDKVNTLNESLQHYKTIEDSMQKALTISEKTSEETINAATDKARQITTEAEIKAEELLADAKQELQDIQNEIYRLQQQKKTFKEQFGKILNAELRMLDGEVIDIDLGDAFEPSASYGGGFSSGHHEGGLGSEGGLADGGGYTGSNPSNFEKTSQDPTFDRGTSLNMDPFTNSSEGGRFSRQTGGTYTASSSKKDKKSSDKGTTSLNIKNDDPKKQKLHRAPVAAAAASKSTQQQSLNTSSSEESIKPAATNNSVKSASLDQSLKININNAAPKAAPEKPAPQSAMAQRLAAHEQKEQVIMEKINPAPYTEPVSGDVESKVNESNMIDSEDNYNTGFDFMEEDNNESYSGEVESKVNESNMIDSEDNYNTGFDFMEEKNETYSGEVESKVNESNMIDSEDNYNTGFDFVAGNEDEEDDIPTIESEVEKLKTVMNQMNNNTDDDDVFVGDVEDKININESHMIGNDDDNDSGFNFL